MVSSLVVGTNTYQSQGDANTLLGDWIHTSAWAAVPSPTKDKALITAFRDIELLNLIDPDTGSAIDASAAPVAIKSAQAELAFTYSQDADAASSATSDGTNIRSVGAGSAKVAFFAPKDGTRFTARVMNWLKPYIAASASAAGTTAASYVSGACDASSFDSGDELLLNRGYA